MQVTADITVVPLGAGDSLSPYVAACEDLLAEAGTHTLILMRTVPTLTGNWTRFSMR